MIQVTSVIFTHVFIYRFYTKEKEIEKITTNYYTFYTP